MYHQNSQIAPPKVMITRPKSAAIVAPATDTAITIKEDKQGLLVGQSSGFSRTTQGSKTARMPGRTQSSATTPSSFFAIPTPPPTRSTQRSKSSNRSTPPAKVFASGIAPSEHFIASPRTILSRSHGRNMETNLNLLAHTEVPSLSSLTPATASATITGNVYHAMAARKAAEDTVKQLARRIAHYRAQEERVLREVHEVKSKLETVLVTTQQQQQALPLGDYHLPVQVWTTPTGCPAGSKQPRREPNTQRSRDQLQFLTKQKRLLQLRKHESAKHQKEKRKVALTSQKMKEEAEKQQKTVQKERIRQEYQRALEERTAKQHHLLEILDGQHRERLTMEKEREDHALDLIEQMREEETQLALRLQALKFHHEFIKHGFDGTSP